MFPAILVLIGGYLPGWQEVGVEKVIQISPDVVLHPHWMSPDWHPESNLLPI